MDKNWYIIRVKRDVHCVPRNDLKTHTKGRRCRCGPRFQDEWDDPAIESDNMPLVVIHTAYDERE
jgi:hypothetical protein